MSVAHLSGKKPAHLSRRSQSRKRTAPLISDALEIWLGDCSAQGFSPKTIAERRGFIQRFIWWLENEAQLPLTLDSLDAPTVRRFLTYARAANPSGRFGRTHPCSKREAAPNTVFGYYRELSAFSKFLVSEELLDEDPLEKVKRPKVPPHLIEPFTVAEVQALVDATRETTSPLRNRVIIKLLADTGMRVSELTSLTCGSVLQDQIVITGKGNKRRHVFLGQKVRRDLKLYLAKERQGAGDEEPLFICDGGTKRGEPLSGNGVRIMMRGLGRIAGIEGKRCSPHTTRHFFACECLKAGMSGFELMRLLGHTDLEMTKRYLNLTQADLQKAHRSASPVDRLR